MFLFPCGVFYAKKLSRELIIAKELIHAKNIRIHGLLILHTKVILKMSKTDNKLKETTQKSTTNTDDGNTCVEKIPSYSNINDFTKVRIMWHFKIFSMVRYIIFHMYFIS